MNITEMTDALIVRFPAHAAAIRAWKPDYAGRLGKLSPADLRESFKTTMATWTNGWPPKPAEFKVRHSRHMPLRAKHPLNVSSEDLFGKPMGNGIEIPDLSDEEFKEWKRQNGELFLMRLATLGTFRRKWPQHEEEFAKVLKTCENEDECYRVLDQWRHGESLDPKRAPEFDPEKVTAVVAELGRSLRENRGMDPRITPECRAFLKDYDRRMAERRPTGQKAERGPTEEYRSDLPGAERRRAMLQTAADAHRHGVLDGTIKLAADYQR